MNKQERCYNYGENQCPGTGKKCDGNRYSREGRNRIIRQCHQTPQERELTSQPRIEKPKTHIDNSRNMSLLKGVKIKPRIRLEEL